MASFATVVGRMRVPLGVLAEYGETAGIVALQRASIRNMEDGERERKQLCCFRSNRPKRLAPFCYTAGKMPVLPGM